MPRKKRGAPPPLRNFPQPATPRHFATRPSLHHTASFSLADEARQTGQSDHSAWDQSTRLRSKPVSFISAGTTAPLELLEEALLDPEAKDRHLNEANDLFIKDLPVELQSQATVDDLGDSNRFQDSTKETLNDDVAAGRLRDIGSDGQETDDAIIGPEDLEPTTQEHAQPLERNSFFLDLDGDGRLATASKPPTVPDRPELDCEQSESSDEEIILFKGRDTAPGPGTIKTTMTMSQIRTEIQVVERQLQTPLTKKRPVRQRGGRGRQHQRATEDEDDAMIEDYVANMRETGEISGFVASNNLNTRDLGGSLSDKSTNEDEASPILCDTSRQSNDEYDNFVSDSELDDETLARIIAIQGSGSPTIDVNKVDACSNSDLSDVVLTRPQDRLAIEQLDLMDWERPSMKRKKKGKAAKGQVNFGVSDSELEHQLQSAFKNDRLKKAQRKQQREELRALGQLGKNAKGPEDMMVKYPGGMTMVQVADEIRSFMMSRLETMTLPPMDPSARKIIHEIANKFNIKSKSTGKADERRPTLYRTARTLPYAETTFDSVINRVHRRYLPRPDARRKRTPGKAKPVHGAGNYAAVKVRNGEIVGAAAPELASSNRGRMMLEKMGWSSGTALGSENNKGILLPVAQTMKTNKAGLG